MDFDQNSSMCRLDVNLDGRYQTHGSEFAFGRHVPFIKMRGEPISGSIHLYDVA